MQVASTNKLNLFVWSGTYGQLTLPNEAGEDIPIQFHCETDEEEAKLLAKGKDLEKRRLPVPK